MNINFNYIASITPVTAGKVACFTTAAAIGGHKVLQGAAALALKATAKIVQATTHNENRVKSLEASSVKYAQKFKANLVRDLILASTLALSGLMIHLVTKQADNSESIPCQPMCTPPKEISKAATEEISKAATELEVQSEIDRAQREFHQKRNFLLLRQGRCLATNPDPASCLQPRKVHP